jgi:hypothetical protein
MKTAMKGTRWFGRLVLTVGVSSLVVLGSGCDQTECVDRFDCRDKVNPGVGRQYVCENNRCVVKEVPGTEVDRDAGTDAGRDAGTDAGVASCDDLPHDDTFGTLRLEQGFAAAGSASLPEGLSAVAAVPNGDDFALYAVRDADQSLRALGTWPALALGATPLHAIVPEAEPKDAFLGGYLTHDGSRLLTGYTRSGASFPGQVLVYDIADPARSSYVSAPGNYSAAGLSGAFLINGMGLADAAESGPGVYALRTDDSPFRASRLASFPVTPAFSGPTAVSTHGVAVLGYSDGNFVNHLRALAPSVYTPALGGGSSLSLADAPSLYSGGDLFSAAGFGTGLALHRGSYDPRTFAALTRDVSRIELTLGGQNLETVTAGELTPVLTHGTVNDTCTRVVLLAPIGADLLVGVSDKNGHRLVRLQKQKP